MRKKILLLGATGYLGSRVCAELHKKKYTVYAFVRPSSDKGIIEPYIKHYIIGDLINKNEISKIIKIMKTEKIAYIISMVGSVDYDQDYNISKEINVITAKNLIHTANILQKSNRLKKVIFISSVASRGFLYSEPVKQNYINEHISYYKKGKSIYSDVKRETEDLINSAIKDNKLNAVIIEPGSLVGNGIGKTSTTNIGLIKKIIKGIPVLKGGASYTSVYRAAEGIVLALEKGKISETYLLGGENMLMNEFAQLVKKIVKKNFPFKHRTWLPVITIPKILALIIGKLNILINNQQALLGNSFHYINSDKAKNDLGYKHSHHDLEDAIIDVLTNIFEKSKYVH